MSRIIRALALGLALTVGLTVSGVATAVADVGDPTIAYGFVTEGNTGNSLTGLQVHVYGVDPTTPDAEPVATATTRADVSTIAGDYEVSLAPGHYWLVMSADGHKSLTVEKDVADTSGQYQNLGGDYLDRQTGTLEGVVNRPEGEGYNCASVEIYQADGDPTDGPVDYTSTGQTETDGYYSKELVTGSYKVFVEDDCGNYVSSWVGGVDFAHATEFTVTSEDTTTVPTVTFDDGSSLSGVVHQGSSTDPLDEISVVLATSDGDTVDSDVTGTDGTYSFGSLAPGSYELRFSDPLAEYEPATRTVTVTGADQIVPAVGLARTDPATDTNLLKGTVTGPAKTGLGNIGVEVIDTDTGDSVDVRTKRDGKYSVNVPVGTYKVYFSEYNDSNETIFEAGDGGYTYQPEWYDNASTYSRAKDVVVGGSAVTVNAELVKNAVISGTIKVQAGYDYYGSVTAYDRDGERVGDPHVSPSGAYTIEGLAPGSYKVKANGVQILETDDDEYSRLIRQYYTGKYSLSAATSIAAGNGAVVTGRNITLSNKLSAYSAPKVSGTAKKGRKLTASVGTWTVMVDTEYTYQWYRGTAKISKAIKSTYTATSSDVGKKLKVVVTGANRYDWYRPGTATSASTKTVVK